MIKELSLTNFQSHKDSSLQLSEGVNVIVGASDSGKTAIIRALRWLITNKPAGDAFRSTWGCKTEVELFTDDAHVVRSRDKENEYVLGDMHFKAFSTETPKEITDALNFSDINLQSQLDAPFLLSQSPGEVASFFNRVAHLESIDKGTSNVNSAVRELTADIKYKSEQEVKLIEDLKTYEHIDIYEYDVEVLEAWDKEKVVLANSVNKLHAATSSYRLTDANLKEKSEILKIDKPLNEVLSLIENKKVLHNDFDRLLNVYGRWHDSKKLIEEINETLTLEKPVLELLQLHSDKKIVQDRVLMLSVLLSNLKGIQDRVVKGNAFIMTQNELFQKEMGDECKLCGQKIIHKHAVN